MKQKRNQTNERKKTDNILFVCAFTPSAIVAKWEKNERIERLSRKHNECGATIIRENFLFSNRKKMRSEQCKILIKIKNTKQIFFYAFIFVILEQLPEIHSQIFTTLKLNDHLEIDNEKNKSHSRKSKHAKMYRKKNRSKI